MKVIEQKHISDPDRSRYKWDFSLNWSDGWCQLDTAEDAWYYGNWVNLVTWEFMSYAEGDFEHTKAESLEEFLAELKRLQQSLSQPVRLDTMCVETNNKIFEEMGLDGVFK